MKKNTRQDPSDGRHRRSSSEPSSHWHYWQSLTDMDNEEVQASPKNKITRKEERHTDIILSKEKWQSDLSTQHRKHKTLKYSSIAYVSGTNRTSSTKYVGLDKNKIHKEKTSCQDHFSKSGEVLSDHIISPSSSSSSSVSSFLIEDRDITQKKWLDVNFTKYITISYPPAASAPFLLLNRWDSKEWFEAQWVYEKHVSEEATRCRTNTVSKERQNNCCKWQKVHHSLSGSCSVKECVVLCQHSRFQLNLPRGLDCRFSKEKLALFIKANVELSANRMSILCSDVHETVHASLHWIMEHLCMSAMRNFLFPVEVVQFLWIGNIQGKALELLKDNSTRLMFPTLPYLNRYRAILILGGDASHLIRHQQTCFLHSIASVLSIQLNEILVLRNIKPNSHLETFMNNKRSL